MTERHAREYPVLVDLWKRMGERLGDGHTMELSPVEVSAVFDLLSAAINHGRPPNNGTAGS